MISPVLAAFGADLVWGDPAWSWHPVRLMGRLISAADARLPRSKAAGALLGLGLPLALGLGSWAILRLLGAWAWPMEAILIFFCVACKDMLRHAAAVLAALEGGDLGKSRLMVARMVGRDTEGLDEAGVLRACVESVAEGFCDGFFAPLFFAFIGGAPLALAHKAVSTLDSMVGYKNEKYADFGWASARLDDLFNYIPARLSALLIAMLSARPLAALKAAWRDAPKQPSPNSGWPEAAFAGALGVQLGGVSSYQGRISEKALLGELERPLDLQAGHAASRLFLRAAILSVVLGELLWRWLKA